MVTEQKKKIGQITAVAPVENKIGRENIILPYTLVPKTWKSLKHRRYLINSMEGIENILHIIHKQ